MLDIVGSYHCMQFQGKPIIQTQEDGEKLYFGPVGRKFGAAIFFVFFLFFVFSKIWLRHSISWSAIIMYNIRKN